MGFIKKAGVRGGFFGPLYIRSAKLGRRAFMVGEPADPFAIALVPDSKPDTITVIANAPFTATDPACGWTYTVNRGIELLPISVTIESDPHILSIKMQAAAACGDEIRYTYTPWAFTMTPADRGAGNAGYNNGGTPLFPDENLDGHDIWQLASFGENFCRVDLGATRIELLDAAPSIIFPDFGKAVQLADQTPSYSYGQTYAGLAAYLTAQIGTPIKVHFLLGGT